MAIPLEEIDLVPRTHLLQSDQLHQYILETSAYPREHELLKALREETMKLELGLMCLTVDTGQLLVMLLKVMNAKKTIELGVFTGYSLLVTALALPSNGKVTAIDVDKSKYVEVGLPYIQKAGVEHKIDFIESEALPALDKLLEEKSTGGGGGGAAAEGEELYDFALVDADKENYLEYHERLLKLVKVGGVIAYDNTLWNGSVCASDEVAASLPPWFGNVRRCAVNFNAVIAGDPRIEMVQLCVGDGITVCRRIA